MTFSCYIIFTIALSFKILYQMGKDKGGFRYVVVRGRNTLWGPLMHKRENTYIFLLKYHKIMGPLVAHSALPKSGPG